VFRRMQDVNSSQKRQDAVVHDRGGSVTSRSGRRPPVGAASRGRDKPWACGLREMSLWLRTPKRRAKGLSELCGGEAPFSRADGDPYLATHHVVWLAQTR
jgi:hypothetical protein